MAEHKRPTTQQEVDANFAQLHPLMSTSEAYYESSRCLYCYDAPCVQACPSDIDIPLFIRQINNENLRGSAKTIYESNYFGNVCGKVCPTEVLCEGACVHNHQNVKPIEIGRLQSYATTKAIKEDRKLFTPAKANGKKVAVIGAGPAGISCACELRLHGYEVDIFEAKSQPSGLSLYGCAPYKITNEEILEEMTYLQKQFDFNVKYKSPIQTAEQLKQLESQYDAIFLGIGLGDTSSIRLKGEDMENCIGATEFIEQVKLNPLSVKVGQKVIVIGGGNTAMDAASECARLGAEVVILAYRRNKEAMGAYDFEYDLAKNVGVQGWFNIQPLEFLGTDTIEGVRFIRTTIENGSAKGIPDSEFNESCDLLILATGQNKQVDFLQKISDMKWDQKGRIQIDPESRQTSNPKYFAGGDAANGGAEVVNASAEGKAAAKGIHNFLK